MDIGIGIPNSIPGTTGGQLLDWARRADSAGFSSLASIGAVEYPSYEELTVFAAAGAVTERIRLLTNVLIAPARSTAELAKQAATVQQLSGGRLTLGVGVGWRETDFQLTGREFSARGRLFDQQLADLQRAWAGQPLLEGTRPAAPTPGAGSVPLLIGGTGDVAVRRVVEFGIGWTAGGLPPEMVKPMLDAVATAWKERGREGSPRNVALVYVALGDEVQDAARSYLLDYYGPMGEMAHMIAGSVLSTPEAVEATIDAFAEVGVDELIFDPCVSDPDQVDRLAAVAL